MNDQQNIKSLTNYPLGKFTLFAVLVNLATFTSICRNWILKR